MIYSYYDTERRKDMFSDTCEYIIKQKTEGKVLLMKIGFIAGYVILCSFLCMLTFLYLPKELYIVIFPCIFALTGFTVFVSWRFTCVEYEIVIAGGDITVTLLYGKGISKKLINMPVNTFSEIGEYDDAAYEEISKLSMQKNHVCLSSLSAPSVYYAIYEEEKDRCIIYFDATDKAVELLKKINPSAFRASAKRMNNK